MAKQGGLVVAPVPSAQKLVLTCTVGSVAKGTATAASDIDVLIVADDLILEDLYSALSSAEKQLGRRISPTLYTVEEFVRRRKEENPPSPRSLRKNGK